MDMRSSKRSPKMMQQQLLRPLERLGRRLVHGCARSGFRGKTPEYSSYQNMLARCLNENHSQFVYYGARGIKVCDRWRNSFVSFLDDMGNRPEGTSLDRINNDGNYEPGNCRWATKVEQAYNRRCTRFLTIQGETLTLAQWSSISKISKLTIVGRIRKGWTPAL